ncbi:MAG TPA: hypothetical protein VI932_01810 [Bacteroidota bacterium]|nr:hypothetical protein [Bacteroidota bacterium]
MTLSRTAALILLALTIGVGAQTAAAQQNGFGLGVILGEPTGFAFKGWMDSKSAIDAGLAWSFLNETTFHVHVDYILHTDALTKRSDMPAYYGIGGRIKTGGHGDDRIGVRIVGGIAYYLPESPIDIFFELAPIIDFAPSTGFQMNGGIGARYFFR